LLSDNTRLISGRLFEQFTGDVCSICYHWSHPKTLSTTVTAFHPSVNTIVNERRPWWSTLFRSADNFQRMMFQSGSTRSAPRLWLSLRDLLLSITLYRVNYSGFILKPFHTFQSIHIHCFSCSDGQIRWFVPTAIRVACCRILMHASAASAL